MKLNWLIISLRADAKLKLSEARKLRRMADDIEQHANLKNDQADELENLIESREK